MTEFEIATLHIELFSAIQASLTVFLSVLSAFLVLSYLAAHRLKPVMAAICLVSYAGFALTNMVGTSSLMRSYAGLTHVIRERAKTGQEFGWHAINDMPPLWVVDALRPGFLVLGSVTLLASIYFFFYHRRANARASA